MTLDPTTLLQAAQAIGVRIEEDALFDLLEYLRAMLDENRTINLTGIREPAAAAVLHVLDSLAVDLLRLSPSDAADIGSGNGFPGVALRVLHPQAKVALIERTTKKALAIGRALDASGLPEVEVLNVDADQAATLDPALERRFDLAVARAVGPPERVAPAAARLLAPGGDLVVWLDADAPAPQRLTGGLQFVREVAYDLPEPAPRHRRLAQWRKRRGHA